MKKSVKKLKLSRETLNQLTENPLGEAKGGNVTFTCPTVCAPTMVECGTGVSCVDCHAK